MCSSIIATTSAIPTLETCKGQGTRESQLYGFTYARLPTVSMCRSTGPTSHPTSSSLVPASRLLPQCLHAALVYNTYRLPSMLNGSWWNVSSHKMRTRTILQSQRNDGPAYHSDGCRCPALALAPFRIWSILRSQYNTYSAG